MTVVRLDDLDIHLVAQHAGGGIQQLETEVHAHAVVGGENDRDDLGRVRQQGFLLGGEASSTDHHGLAGLAADLQVLQSHRRMGEVDQHVEFVHHLGQIARQRHADTAQGRQFAGISANQGAIRTIDGSGQPGVLRLLHRLDQGLAHAPGGAHHSYTSHRNQLQASSLKPQATGGAD
ncbi:hypothetical protein D3C84_893800 [compost metagenome]